MNNTHIILVSLLLVAGSFGLFKLQVYRDGNMALARTLAVNVFIFGQMFYLFNCRSLTRPVRIAGRNRLTDPVQTGIHERNQPITARQGHRKKI